MWLGKKIRHSGSIKNMVKLALVFEIQLSDSMRLGRYLSVLVLYQLILREVIMDDQQTLKWLLDNLPDWPSSECNFMNIPDPHWHWLSDKAWINGVYSEDYFAVNVISGEIVSGDDFFNARAKQRLNPCGMSFNEMIADLSE